MAGKKQNAAQLKAAKQKKIVIGGAVLLVGLMVIQGPKMLKLMSGGSTTSTAAPAVTPLPGAPIPGAVPAPTTPAPAATASTKLVSFERFSSKDPFNAQIVAPTTASNADDGGPVASNADTPTATSTAGTGAAVTLVPKATTSTSKSSTEQTVQKTIQANGTPTNGSAQIKINDTAETVNKGKDFPKSDPTFTLAEVKPQTVKVSIAGGSLKAGGKVFTLYMNVPKTLLNTADGKRYTLELVSVTLPNT